MNRLLMIVYLGLISLPLLAAENLSIDDAWTPEAPPGRMMAGFMVIDNPGPEDVILVDASSPQFGHVEIHTMVMDDGVMRMRRLEQLVIPAGERVELKPGGLHLMLIEPKGVYGLGEQLEVNLIAADESRIQLFSVVRPRPGMRAH
jgi:periplasmic copper chaperone A